MGRRVMVIYNPPAGPAYTISHTKSLDLTTTEDIANFTDNTWGIVNAWTVALWFKDTDGDGLWALNTYLFQMQNSGNTQSAIVMEIRGATVNDPVRVTIRNTAGSIIKAYTWDNMANGTGWMHLAFTWDGTNLKGYRDGSFVAKTASTTDTTGTMGDNPRRISVLCSTSGTSNTPGIVHSLALWNVALSGTDISEIYNSGSGYNYNVRNTNNDDLVQWTLFGYAAGDNFHNEVGSVDLGLSAANLDDTDQVTDYPGI